MAWVAVVVAAAAAAAVLVLDHRLPAIPPRVIGLELFDRGPREEWWRRRLKLRWRRRMRRR